MVFKKKKKMPEVAEKARLVLIFRRMMEEMRSLSINLNDGKIRARVLDVLDDAIFVEVAPKTKSEGKLLPKMSVAISLIHEGKEYFGKLKVMGVGRYHSKDAVRFLFPATLGINDEFGLTNHNLFPRPEVAFTSTTNKFCEGSAVNIGSKGIDIRSRSEIPIRELVNESMETDLSFVLGDVVRISVRAQVLYIKNLGEEVFGAEFLNLNADTERKLNDWIAKEERAKQERDAAFLRKAKKPVEKPKRGAGQSSDIDTTLRLLDDYQTEVYPGEDYILLLCQDDNLSARVGKALKRKYGVLMSKGRFSNVKQIIEHYDPALILIHQQLGQVDGFELCKTMKTHLAHKSISMVVMISEQVANLAEKIAESQADDCVVVEPFKPLFFFKKIDEMLELF